MSEQKMPARIWVGRQTGWAAFEMRGDTAFVRSDIAERMAEALERIQAFVQNEFEQYDQLIEAGKGVHGEPGYVRDSVWSSWSGKRNMCEGIIAAIKQENAALSAFRSATQDREANR